ncbi:MAG: hypothetical protein FRX48_02790 [Lasallia pustulata]|uniref:Beta-lactamase-like n=1 Tax=Lasallia pustulata TaxID=136370 RepID=A0A1W5DAD4_9LECA|nr:MAG: hypothetical protein FRX48_02790 [Lasallia pustulata]SLM39950.1 Beta-lactamase-like [Lasallia pustulata]
MSLKVEHLNGDSTFLLTFSPFEVPQIWSSEIRAPGAFTVLVDPWISGPSKVWHAKFSLSKHTIPSSIEHLSDMPEPDVVLISQDKPDHCHEATLRQLNPCSKYTTILAEPAAAKKIQGWNYFDRSKVHALPPFSSQKQSTIVRFMIPSPMPGGLAGEATVAFIPAKRDLTGLHNAIGITYRPPSLPPRAPTLSKSSTRSSVLSLPIQTASDNLPDTPPQTPPSRTSTLSSTTASSRSDTTASSLSSTPLAFRPALLNRERTLSVIYSPHGVTYSHILPYATTHLVQAAALPLTLLLHCFDRVQNPWYLGGNISAGLPGGLEIARNLFTRCWISAHDEDKEITGFSVGQVVTRKYAVEEVKKMVEEGRKGEKLKVDVRALACGESIVLGA